MLLGYLDVSVHKRPTMGRRCPGKVGFLEEVFRLMFQANAQDMGMFCPTS